VGKPRKHVQQELAFRTWGGKREGAGRPPKGHRSSEAHKVRPHLTGRDPVHVTTRVVTAVGTLRRRKAYQVIRRALGIAQRRHDFRIVHISLQRKHLHLIAEAASKQALAKGMQAFEIAAARGLNAALSRTGSVFPDRYHARALTSPRAVRHGINYVLNNWRHHDEDQDMESMFWLVDPFSSAVNFGGWVEVAESPFAVPEDLERLPTALPETWLLSVGWMKAGTISANDRPGPEARRVVM
jgi:REP element-mobilizing transposase RayT